MEKKHKKSKRRSDIIFVTVMLAFPIVQFCLMWIGVNFNSILLAFQEYDINFNVTWSANNFVKIYDNIMNDKEIGRLMVNSLIFWFAKTLLTLPTSILISFYFYKRYKHHNAIKTAYFIPGLISSVVKVTIFYVLVDRAYPLIMKNLFGKEVLGLLVDSNTQFATIMFYNIFFSLAGSFLYYSSAMSTVSEDISEAAQIDGATPMKELFYVTLPAIYPMLSVQFIASIPGIFINDHGLYAFYRATGFTGVNVLGNYFIQGLTEQGQRSYPYFSAFGLIISVLACIITFSAKAILDHYDPMRVQDGSEKHRNRRKGKPTCQSSKKITMN